MVGAELSEGVTPMVIRPLPTGSLFPAFKVRDLVADTGEPGSSVRVHQSFTRLFTFVMYYSGQHICYLGSSSTTLSRIDAHTDKSVIANCDRFMMEIPVCGL